MYSLPDEVSHELRGRTANALHQIRRPQPKAEQVDRQLRLPSVSAFSSGAVGQLLPGNRGQMFVAGAVQTGRSRSNTFIVETLLR